MRDERPMSEAAIEALVLGRHGDPFALLGPHREGEGWVIRALLPGARAVTALARSGETLAAFRRVHPAGLFEAEIRERPDYRLCIDWDGVIQETEDPYSFPPLLGELDVYLLAEGRHRRIAECLGAQPTTCEGVPGVRFAVWAPNARRVSVIGAFNSLGRATASDAVAARLRRVGDLRSAPRRRASFTSTRFSAPMARLTERADPLARAAEPPPATASIVADAETVGVVRCGVAARAGRPARRCAARRSTRCTRLRGDVTPTDGRSRGWSWPTRLFPTCATSASRMSSSCR